MIFQILAICVLAMTPVVVYSASTWPDEPKIDMHDRAQQELFYEHLAAHQRLHREKLRREFEGEDRPRSVRP
jgi:hypothetical protein